VQREHTLTIGCSNFRSSGDTNSSRFWICSHDQWRPTRDGIITINIRLSLQNSRNLPLIFWPQREQDSSVLQLELVTVNRDRQSVASNLQCDEYCIPIHLQSLITDADRWWTMCWIDQVFLKIGNIVFVRYVRYSGNWNRRNNKALFVFSPRTWS